MADIQEILAWKAKADSDFTAAKDLLKIKSSSTDAICFHCQQAVEIQQKKLR
jgi:HEPN domain-containing protein